MMTPSMNESRELTTTVVICTLGRPAILHATVRSLLRQTKQPSKILLGICDDVSVSAETKAVPLIEVVRCPRMGTSAQRNACLQRVTTSYTLFIDDDVELKPNYIESMELLLDREKQIAIAMGELIADGARNDIGYTHAQAESFLAQHASSGKVTSLETAISCSFFVRTALFDEVRFDERLPLYGWLEDLDFCTQAKQRGMIVQNGFTASVHLGATTGRTSGVRFGYSQIANPFYLWRKGGEPTLGRVLVKFWLRLVVANVVRSIFPGNSKRIDRPGRLKGNLLAFRDLVRNKMAPERILLL